MVEQQYEKLYRVMSKRPRYRALVIQRRLTHYRTDFFEVLREELHQRDCELHLAYGEPASVERSKDDSGILTRAERLETRYFFADRICWQPFGRMLAEVDIAVLTSENKLIYNLIAQIFSRTRALPYGDTVRISRVTQVAFEKVSSELWQNRLIGGSAILL